MLALVASGKSQIFVRSLPGFLDEAMQQHHPILRVDIEQDSRDSILCQVCAHFVNSIAKRPTNRHADWLAKLHRL
jgi:hypothetical protein